MGKAEVNRQETSRQRRVAGEFDKVLYVRASRELLHALDSVAERQRKQKPWRSVSRSDVAREILWEAVQRMNEAAEGDSAAEQRQR